MSFQRWVDSTSSPSIDQQFAGELEQIAQGSASGTALEAPLRDMAAEFRAGQLNISSDVITELCAGNTPVEPSAGEIEARATYLARVRAEAPALRMIADDDLLAATDAVCADLDLGLGTEDVRQQYLILTSTANTAIGHENEDETAPAIRAAVEVYCPQHTDAVNEILEAG